MPDPDTPIADNVDTPLDACTYVRNADGTLTRVDEPTAIPEFAPKE